MNVNKYRPHVMVLPEDDANRQLANGFLMDDAALIRTRSIQILPEAGGWGAVLDCFKSDHAPEMERRPERYVVLLIDFDGDPERLTKAKAVVPNHLEDRVFVLGTWTEPEDLKRASLGTYEVIGKAMARDCLDETDTIWAHKLLAHNAGELARLRTAVRPILFPAV